MKLPVMLRSTHDKEIQSYRRVETILKIDNSTLSKKCIELDNKNCELSKDNKIYRDQLDELVIENKNIISLYNDSQEFINKKNVELEELEQKLKEAKWCIEEANKKIDRLETNATIHRIMKKQLKDLCILEKSEDEIFIKVKVSGQKVWNLARMIG